MPRNQGLTLPGAVSAISTFGIEKFEKEASAKSHRSVFLVLRITSKPHGLSLSRRNGTVPDRKVPQARRSMSHHGAETPVPQC